MSDHKNSIVVCGFCSCSSTIIFGLHSLTHFSFHSLNKYLLNFLDVGAIVWSLSFRKHYYISEYWKACLFGERAKEVQYIFLVVLPMTIHNIRNIWVSNMYFLNQFPPTLFHEISFIICQCASWCHKSILVLHVLDNVFAYVMGHNHQQITACGWLCQGLSTITAITGLKDGLETKCFWVFGYIKYWNRTRTMCQRM